MKAKLEMAHDYLLKIIPESPLVDDGDIEFAVATAWKYADTMQAELDKRNKAEAAQKRKEIREMLSAPNTFVEREGQHFDDVEEWQPDWSQAPEWARYWAVREGSDTALWCINKPTITDDCFLSHGSCSPAPTFGFTGSHIVERSL